MRIPTLRRTILELYRFLHIYKIFSPIFNSFHLLECTSCNRCCIMELKMFKDVELSPWHERRFFFFYIYIHGFPFSAHFCQMILCLLSYFWKESIFYLILNKRDIILENLFSVKFQHISLKQVKREIEIGKAGATLEKICISCKKSEILNNNYFEWKQKHTHTAIVVMRIKFWN